MKRYSGYMIVDFNNILAIDEEDLADILNGNLLNSLGNEVYLDKLEINFEEEEPYIPEGK